MKDECEAEQSSSSKESSCSTEEAPKAECGLGDSNNPCEDGGIESYEAEENMSEAVNELNSQADTQAKSGNQLQAERSQWSSSEDSDGHTSEETAFGMLHVYERRTAARDRTGAEGKPSPTINAEDLLNG
eukprot:15391600-Alexandrium_andersonii.AAC.1